MLRLPLGADGTSKSLRPALRGFLCVWAAANGKVLHKKTGIRREKLLFFHWKKIFLKKLLTFQRRFDIINKSVDRSGMEKSPSPVYGARLELVYVLIAHRGFESLLLRHKSPANFVCRAFVLQFFIRIFRINLHMLRAKFGIKSTDKVKSMQKLTENFLTAKKILIYSIFYL